MINPDKAVVDQQVSKLSIVARADVAAPTWPKEQGKYVVYADQPPDGEVWVIYEITCFAWARTNVEDPPSSSEGVQRIPSANGDGFFLFQPQVGGKDALGLSKNSLAAWTTAAGATSSDQNTASGITLISDAPFDANKQAAANADPLFSVPPGNPFTMLFSLLPDAVSNPLPARFTLGTTLPVSDALQRVDYVAFIATGVKMSKSYYDTLEKKSVR